MNMSRKDFFRKSLYSIGEAVCRLSAPAAAAAPVEPEPECEPEPDWEADFVPSGRDDLTAVACNEHCLAAGCGCFACLERCEPQAIQLAIGKGIRIDEARCTGCGACEYVCPVTPKAVRLRPRTTV